MNRVVLMVAVPLTAALGLQLVPSDVEEPPAPRVINGSCGSDLHLDITYPVIVEEPATLYVQITDTAGYTYTIPLIDNDGDPQGFHPTIPADQLPDGGYDVVLSAAGNDVYVGMFDQGEVCGGSGLPTVTPSPLPTVSPEPSGSPSVEPSTLPGRVPGSTPSPDPSGSALPEATVSPDPDTDAGEAGAADAVPGSPSYVG
ncbi:hypothetical protein [Demequina zhanjiangensis]|uniref:Uncharacterized protein n=1 Tax=Demequina zhanjiangensis TaxID=3051659 RepID=A0ABT8G2W8_9MICO|nr:hypothetical protein [Demequina sp. SYSU T00b26]MDN4473489.1 hypothetical protein [Demequina sp. SYSU T00b26]